MKVTPKFWSSTIPQIFNISYSVELMKPELRAYAVAASGKFAISAYTHADEASREGKWGI